MLETCLLPLGFQAAGIHCGIKSDPQQQDLVVFFSEHACTSAGVFTQNQVVGAPVVVSRTRVPRETTKAVIINSGNANACTGDQGDLDALWMTAQVAQELGVQAEDVLICSTGIIGHFLPRKPLVSGIPACVKQLSHDPTSFYQAALGMMTTDTVPKLAMRSAEIEGRKVLVSGAAKGAAMIAPQMATMLAVIMTDVSLSCTEADEILRTAVDQSFHCISVDGHTSTSDTVLFLANGASGVKCQSVAQKKELQQMVNQVTQELALAIIHDAEGADHLISVQVQGLRTPEEAFQIAKTVAESLLVKTAIAGADPNWGRIVSAVGYSGVQVSEQDIHLRLNGVSLYRAGVPLAFDQQALSETLKKTREVEIMLEFELGTESASFWTSDLTTEYVRLNSEYTT